LRLALERLRVRRPSIALWRALKGLCVRWCGVGLRRSLELLGAGGGATSTFALRRGIALLRRRVRLLLIELWLLLRMLFRALALIFALLLVLRSGPAERRKGKRKGEKKAGGEGHRFLNCHRA
jgi:hypothetical protein